MYGAADFEKNRKQYRKTLGLVILCALPGLAMGIAGAAARIEMLCTAGFILCGAALIFVGDLRLMPVIRYKRFLKEITSGISHQTAGTLVHLGGDPVYTDGVWFNEVILNVYEDLSEEGERRFLLDSSKEIPAALVGQDVALTSHGNYVLDVRALEESHVDAAD